MKTLHKLFLVLLVCLLPFIASVGCDDDDDDDARIRALHMSYDAPAVNILVDEDVIAPDLTYPESSGYAKVNDGDANIRVVPTEDPTNVVLEAQQNLDGDDSYTLVAVDQLSQIDALFTRDDLSVVSDKAKVRFIHAVPDAPAVDIKTGTVAGTPVFANVMFKDITPYLTVDGGEYVFVVTPTGTETEVVSFNPVTLENGEIYTVVAHGTLDALDDVPFMVRVFIDTGEGAEFVDLADARLMAIHASPDAPAVDVLVDDNTAASNLEFPDNTGYLGAMAGTRNVKVNAAGTGTTVIDADLDLEMGSDTSVFAFDELATIQPLVLDDDLTPPAAGKAHVRFVHLSPDAPPVDITLTDGTVVFDDVAFGESDNSGMFTPVDAGAYDLEVRLAGEETVVLALPTITLEDGIIYTVFANGYATPEEGQPELGAEIIVNNPEDREDAAAGEAMDDSTADDGSDGN